MGGGAGRDIQSITRAILITGALKSKEQSPAGSKSAVAEGEVERFQAGEEFKAPLLLLRWRSPRARRGPSQLTASKEMGIPVPQLKGPGYSQQLECV